MLDALFALVQHNQMLTAGLGTVAFGSVMYILRAVPRWCYNAFQRLFTLELSLTSNSAQYFDLLAALSRCRIAALATNFTTGDEERIVAGYGDSLALYRGRLVIFNRHIMDDKMRLEEQLKVRIFSRNVGLLRALVAEAEHPTETETIKVFLSSDGYWCQPLKKRKRDLATVFANGDCKREVIERIDRFLKSEDWYRCRGIPYKLVFLLHGPPGTGKTSLIYGLASHFNRALCSVTSLTNVAGLVRYAPENAFVAFEDIDMMAVAREQDDDEDKVAAPGAAPAPPPAAAPVSAAVKQIQLSALQTLINTLDGFSTPHGLIVFITTNHKDRLDHALIRPGRIDCDIEVGPLGAEATRDMFAAYYGEPSASLIDPYLRSPDFTPRTGAEVQQALLGESRPSDAVRRLWARQERQAAA